MTKAKPGRKKSKPGRVEEAAEHIVDAVRDRVRGVELGLDKGDHSIVGELAAVIVEEAHPEGEEEKQPRRRR